MARVTDNEVKVVIPTSITITAFVDVANRLVTDLLGSAGLTSAVLKDIELYVAAHVVALRVERGAPRYEQIGDSRMSWDTVAGPGLKMTRFGQLAIILDTSGILQSKATSGGTAKFRAFG